MSELNLKFYTKKETPGTVVYTEEGDAALHKVGTLYIKKTAHQEMGSPQNIEVTIRTVA